MVMAAHGRNVTLRLRYEEDLAVVSPPGRDGWRIQGYYPPLLTGKGEAYQGGPYQLADGVQEVTVTLPPAWLEKEFPTPEAAAEFVNRGMAAHWPRIIARTQGRRFLS
jgi:hypothetical protein